jgi:hypothetical protein
MVDVAARPRHGNAFPPRLVAHSTSPVAALLPSHCPRHSVWGAPVKQCSCLAVGWVDDRTILVGSITPLQGRPSVRIEMHDVAGGAEHAVLERPLGAGTHLYLTIDDWQSEIAVAELVRR